MVTRSTRSGLVPKAVAAALASVFTVLACAENITAPGACPEFCPVTVLDLRDTILTGAVERDSSFVGYAVATRGLRIMVSDSGTPYESRGVVRFLRLPDSILFGAVTRPIVGIDSFRVRLDLRDRDLAVSGLEVVLHRIPAGVDSNVTFDELTPYFADSTVIGSLTVSDSAKLDSLFVPVVADAFPSLEPDSFVTAVGITVRGSSPTFAGFTSIESGVPATLTRYSKVDSTDGTIVDHQDVRGAAFDTFVHEVIPAPPGDILTVGGEPTARSLLRLTIPPVILDSSEIVGAKLRLIPVNPVAGAPGDSMRVQVNSLSADFGPKSPLVENNSVQVNDSTITLPGTMVAVGSADTIVLDMTTALRSWQADSTRPHSIMIRLAPTLEGATIGSVFFGSSRTAGMEPLVSITYVPPFRFEGN